MHSGLIPLYWRRRLAISWHNLRSRPTARVRVRRAGPLVQLQIGDEGIGITAIGRWKRYRGGISARLEAVAGRYGTVALAKDIAGGTVIDIGANIGELSLYCNRLGCQVFAVEPDPVNFLAVQENARGTGIRPFQLAFWHEEAELTFYSAVARADSSLIEPEAYERAFPVQATTLDRFAAEQGIGAVVFIKADAEGAEPEVLRGATQTLGRTRWICLDCGPERKGEKTFVECAAILEGLGFATRALDSRGNMLFGENRRLGAGD